MESDFTICKVDKQYWPMIEKASATSGMVVSQNLEFKLVIENGANPQPDLVFDVARTDILQNLRLAWSGTAQTMQYDFINMNNTGTFVSTTVPGFDNKNSKKDFKKDFHDLIWPVVGEAAYATVLSQMGKKGVPLPIMKDFQFHFESAKLSVQPGFVSILANVQFKGS